MTTSILESPTQLSGDQKLKQLEIQQKQIEIEEGRKKVKTWLESASAGGHSYSPVPDVIGSEPDGKSKGLVTTKFPIISDTLNRY